MWESSLGSMMWFFQAPFHQLNRNLILKYMQKLFNDFSGFKNVNFCKQRGFSIISSGTVPECNSLIC